VAIDAINKGMVAKVDRSCCESMVLLESGRELKADSGMLPEIKGG